MKPSLGNLPWMDFPLDERWANSPLLVWGENDEIAMVSSTEIPSWAKKWCALGYLNAFLEGYGFARQDEKIKNWIETILLSTEDLRTGFRLDRVDKLVERLYPHVRNVSDMDPGLLGAEIERLSGTAIHGVALAEALMEAIYFGPDVPNEWRKKLESEVVSVAHPY